MIGWWGEVRGDCSGVLLSLVVLVLVGWGGESGIGRVEGLSVGCVWVLQLQQPRG